MTSTIIAALFLAFTGPPAPDEGVPAIEDAQALYEQGTVRYEAADYAGAIEAFTEALSVAQKIPGSSDKISLTLLYNIASAHEQAYDIDHDVTHLRQALTLYERYRDFADEKGDLKEQLDVGARVARLRRMLEELEVPEPQEADEQTTPSTGKPRQDDSAWKRPRNLGLGLAVGGGVATITGIVFAAAGSTYEGNAEDEVAKLAGLGVPPDHPAWAEGDTFIAAEARKGRIMMGVGATVAVLGAAAAGTGVYYLVKAKKARDSRVNVAPVFGAGFAGVQLRGRF